MKFKEFLKLSEEQSGTDKGLMGYPQTYYIKKPSDGRPFKNLAATAGMTPRGNSGGSTGDLGGMSSTENQPMMMKKFMKK